MMLRAIAFVVAVSIWVFPESSEAARRVFGVITNVANGAPVSNAKVEAWDRDPGTDDKMGESISLTNGSYVVNYEGRHWDPCPEIMTCFRPDIYIRVFVNNPTTGNWLRVYTSSTHSNHVQQHDLQINASISPPAKVYGFVSLDGAPYVGKKVKVFDKDYLSGDELMGQTTTGSDGAYQVFFANRNYDPSWLGPEPDIFAVVYDNNSPKKYSHVYRNYSPSRDLRIDLAVTTPPPPSPPSTENTCNGTSPTGSAKSWIVLFEDYRQCGYAIPYFANSLEEARGCAIHDYHELNQEITMISVLCGYYVQMDPVWEPYLEASTPEHAVACAINSLCNDSCNPYVTQITQCVYQQ